MTIRQLLKAAAAAFVLFSLGSGGALAANNYTTAGTDVTNKATINFQVGGVAQTAVESSPTGNSTPGVGNGTTTSFKVDNKVNVVVTRVDATYVSGAPGSQVVYKFQVANQGNKTQDYDLTAADFATDPFGGTDNIDLAPYSVFVESGGSQVTDTYNGATDSYDGADTGTYIDELAPDRSITVYVVKTLPLTVTNGDIAALTLTAETRVGGTAASEGVVLTYTTSADAWVQNTEQNVAADGAGTTTEAAYDGKHSASGAFKVAGAVLTVTKTVTVVDDPINGTTNPKAIPGATMEYTIAVANAAGSATATNVTVADAINGNLTFKTDGYGAGTGIQVTAPNLYSGAATALTNAGGDDEGDYNVTTATTVTVTGISLAATESATVKFRATVK